MPKLQKIWTQQKTC